MRDTIDMARESWLDTYGLGKDHFSFVEALKRFEALVRADERDRAIRENAYVLAEREACAKVCEAGVNYEHPTVKGHIMENFGHSRLLANAIRARGNT
jgi:hypothetical protein